MVSLGTVRIRQLARNRRERVQYGRWLRNEKVTPEEMMACCGERVRALAAGRHVLAIHDTSEANYQRHAGRTRGLGTVGNGSDAGFYVHPVLAVDADTGACLGLVGAQLWLRTEAKAADYRKQPIETKESYRWLRGAETAKRYLDTAAHVTVVADRESDIYEEWARLPSVGFDLLTRASSDRVVAGGGRLFAFTDSLPVVHHYEFAVPALPGKRAARQARMELRFGRVTIQRPRICSDPDAPASVTLSVVDVREIPDPSCQDEPIHWRLLTTHPIESIEDALRLVGWYRQRWNIEQLFRTLKRQGLDIEASELETGAGLLRLAALAVQVATRTMQLVLARNGGDEQPATAVFEPEELPVLAALQPTLEGRTEKQRNPHPLASLAWAAWIIARLGGWNGYKSESPPGPVTMHHGLARFASLADGWNLARDNSHTLGRLVCTG
jgi:hypothetical protein